MAFTDFYINNASGSNLNAGSTSADAGGGSYSAVYTSTSGNWDGTSIFTPTDSSTPASTVSVGMWISVYPNANSVTPYVAQVTAVAAGVNGAITAPAANSFGTKPTSSSGGISVKVGGSWADLGMLAAGAALNTGTVTQSTRVNIKAGTYASTTTNRTFALAGATTTPLWWRGYQTTPGDQDGNNLAVAGTNIPAFTFTTGQMVCSGAYSIFSNIDVNGACTTSPGQINSTGADNLYYNFRSQNTAANAQGRAMTVQTGVGQQLFGCYFKATTTANYTLYTSAANGFFQGCVFTSGAASFAMGNTTFLDGCVFDSPVGDAIQIVGVSTMYINNCSFYGAGSSSGNGINLAYLSPILIANCYFSNFAGTSKAAINNTSGANTSLVKCLANAYYNCTNNVLGLGDYPLIFDNGTQASEAFTAPASQNFSVSSEIASLGFPGKFELVSAYQGYLDLGAVQRQPSSGGPVGRGISTGGRL